jgi:hypothetical protein
MSRLNKILLGVLAFFPLGYILFFMAFTLLFMASMFSTIGAAGTTPGGQPVSPFPMMAPFFMLFGVHLLAMLVMMAQMAVFVVLLFRNDRLDGDKRILWLIVLLLAGWIGAPLYWYLQIWKAPNELTPPTG